MTPGAADSFRRPGQRGTRRRSGRSETVETQGRKSFPTELAWCPPSPRLLLSVKGASFPQQRRPPGTAHPRSSQAKVSDTSPAEASRRSAHLYSRPPARTLFQKVAGSEGCNLAGCGSNPGTCSPERTALRSQARGGPPGSDCAASVYHHAFNSLLCSHQNRKTFSPATKNLEFSNQEKGS